MKYLNCYCEFMISVLRFLFYRKLFNITYNAKKVKILLIARINVKQDVAN